MKGERTAPGPVSILMPVCNEAEIIEDVIEEWAQDVFRYLLAKATMAPGPAAPPS